MTLVLDLDGTLVPTDTLLESALRLLARNPLLFLQTLLTALTSRAAFKARLAELVQLDPASLVYNPAVLELAKQARAAGTRVVLATAANRAIADAVATHLGLFDEVMASDAQHNLKGLNKAAALVAKFGKGGFDYAGDAFADLPVWREARRAIVVAPGKRLLAAVRQVCADVQIIGQAPGLAKMLRLSAKALRLHQWAKNVLIFVPMLGAHRMGGTPLVQSCLAFIAFSLCASSVYVLNDVIDLPHDRAHPTKRRRPFASGSLTLLSAPLFLAVFLALALLASLALPWKFCAMLAIYYACTLSYSFVLKRRAVWDVLMLAGLYTIRVFAGSAATGIVISPWLLAFSLFLFFCLAVVKRLTELTLFAKTSPAGKSLSGRGYGPEDMDILRSMATSSGYMAVLVMALYVNSTEVSALYPHPKALWALCPILLFWVSRVVMLANRGQMNDDPVVFALRDRVSLATGAGALFCIVAAAL